MTKKLCAICEANKVGWMSNLIGDEKDGNKICDKCLDAIGIKGAWNADLIVKHDTIDNIKSMIANGKKYDVKQRTLEVKQMKKDDELIVKEEKNKAKQDYKDLVQSFKDNGASIFSISNVMFDDKEKRILFKKTMFHEHELYNYSDLAKYVPIIRDGSGSTHHGLTRAVIGGGVAGPLGAIVGATTGNKTYSTLLEVSITLIFKNGSSHVIKLINTETKGDTLGAKFSLKEYRDITHILEVILVTNDDSDNNDKSSDNGKSKIDEIKDLKIMLDEGLITKDEFDISKKKILGI